MLLRRAVKDDRDARTFGVREVGQLVEQTTTRAALVLVPPDALRHHVVAVHQVAHRLES
jgi:hypothetical protein